MCAAPGVPARLLDHLICQEDRYEGIVIPSAWQVLRFDEPARIYRLLHRGSAGLAPLRFCPHRWQSGAIWSCGPSIGEKATNLYKLAP